MFIWRQFRRRVPRTFDTHTDQVVVVPLKSIHVLLKYVHAKSEYKHTIRGAGTRAEHSVLENP